MSDFYQNGVVTTLHRLNPDGLERLETELKWYSRTRPVGLVLPALYSEFETPAMRRIVAELERVDYLRQTVRGSGARQPRRIRTCAPALRKLHASCHRDLD